METNYLSIDDLRHRREVLKDSVLNVIISAYPHVETSAPFRARDGRQICLNLADVILSEPPPNVAKLQAAIRGEQDSAKRKVLKKKMFAFTPSGLFDPTRKAYNLESHTGLIAFDIDPEHNAGRLLNYEALYNEIIKIPYTAYCGRSTSGTGLWGLFAIPKATAAERHKEHFAAMERDFAAMGVLIDPACSDVCRLRIYSHDPEGYVNHYPLLYESAYIAPQAPQPKQKAWSAATSRTDAGKRPGDAFNDSRTCEDVLTAFGFVVKSRKPNEIQFTRPGAKTRGNDVSVYLDNGKAKVWSTSVDAPEKGELSPFALYAHLQHGGDWKAAAKAIGQTGK